MASKSIFDVVDPDAWITGEGNRYPITFRNRTPSQLEYCASYIITDILPLMSKHNGKVFGGFVRDVLVPHFMLGKELKDCENFRDVDIWFSTLEDLKEFLAESKLDDPGVDSLGRVFDDSLYPFNVIHGIISNGDIGVSFADYIVSPTFPVNDFNVNSLTFQFIEGSPVSEVIGYDATVDELVRDIENKTIHMREEYIQKSQTTIECHKPNIIARIKTRYLDRGWKVMVRGKLLEPSHLPANLRHQGHPRVPREVIGECVKMWGQFLESTNNPDS
jgi:hypothetical protein